MGARALLLALCACAARPGHAARKAATAQEVLIQNIKEKLVTDNDDYVPNDNESELNLVANDAKFELNDFGRNTAPTRPESTVTPVEPARALSEAANFRSDPKELDETRFEIAFDSNIARPKIKMARKSHEVWQEPKIAQSEFEFDQLEPNTAPPERNEPELNPVFAKLEPSFSQPEFNYAPDFDVDQLEHNTAPPETTHAELEPTVAQRHYKFSQSDYAEFEFNIQSKYRKHKNPPIEPKETWAAEPEAEIVPKETIAQIEDTPTASGQKTSMLEMVEDISEKTERRGRGDDEVSKSALRTNQIPNAHSPFHTEPVPNKRFVVQLSRFASSTDGASSPSATGREESRGDFGHTTEPGAARRSTDTGATPEVVPAIVVYNFYPIPTGASKPKKFKNKKVRETSRSVAELQRGRQSGRKAPRQRPRVERGGTGRGGRTPKRPLAEREGTVPKRPRRGGVTRHPKAARSGASKVRPREGDRDGSSLERPRAGKRDGTTPESSSSGVITFRYRAEIPLEVPLSRNWIENAFS